MSTQTVHPRPPAPVDGVAPGTARWYVPLLLGGVATVALFLGMSGIGDAPNPHDAAADMQRHFLAVRDDIYVSAPFAYVGAAALVLFTRHVAARLGAGGSQWAAQAVAAGGVTVATYFAGVTVVYTSLAYEVAATSADVTKALFAITILAVPVLAAGGVAMLAGFAYGNRDARLVPRWLALVSTVGAVVCAFGLVSFAYDNYFSPDVQQQFVGAAATLWPLLVGAALAVRARKERRAAVS